MTRNEYYNSKEFQDKYHYEGALGSFCGPSGTDFELWAPTADAVELCLYQNGDGEETPVCQPLQRGERGVWHLHVPENLNGTYYQYRVTVDGITQETGDPYARACGLNGFRSMVIDLSKTNPKGWDEDRAPERTPENIIYEVHVKDFTWDASSGVSPEKRGKYLGICESGTTLNGDGEHATAIDYLQLLGVTHVQLMPVYDYGSVDETGEDDGFNWGYDPVNFNAPEGSYSADPYHGEVRIRELKEAIMGLHKKGFRVVMDVVYNHTYELDSWLNRTVPGYYYRFEEDGTPSDGSRCGNDTASERSMCAKYILDSVLYWAEEYHLDGFRFDLMGLMPVDLMNQIRYALNERYGKGEKLVYGEPWRAADTACRPGTILADKENLPLLDLEVGAFCDSTRDAVKGNLMVEDAKGMANGGDADLGLLAGCLKGWSRVPGEFTVNAPSQTINYLSCHDDWTLWDRLVNTLEKEREYESLSSEKIRANRLAAAILFNCQGHLFLLSGEEGARTKNGIKNSFRSPIEANRIDWNRMWESQELMDYYRGLIALRKQQLLQCDKTEDAGNRIHRMEKLCSNCISVEMRDEKQESRWENMFLLYNMTPEAQTVRLPEGIWQYLADGTDSFLWKQNCTAEGMITAEPMTATILGK